MKKHIFFLSLIILALSIFSSCEKEQPYRYIDFFAEDTPQSLIVQLQNKFTIEEVTENSTSYTVTFHNPSYFVSKTNQVYPDGIKTLTVDKAQVSKYATYKNSVEFIFRPFKSAMLYYYNKQNPIHPLEFSISYDMNSTYRFEDYNGTLEIPFTVTKNDSESEISVTQPSNDVVKTELRMNPDRKSGIIVLTPNTEWDIDQEINFNIGSNEIWININVHIVRKESLFLDNNQKEITLELDDIARRWWVNLTYNDKRTYDTESPDPYFEPIDEYIATITEGSEWITLENVRYVKDAYPRMSNKGATLFLNFKHFIGSGTRKGTILIKRKNCDEELKVNVIQSGSENPGSIRSALMALYNQCGGSEWKLQKNWGSDLDVEEWCGISFRTLAKNDEYNQKCPEQNGYAPSGGAYGPPENTALEFDFWHEGYWNVIKGKIPDEFWNIKCGFKYFTVSFVENADINKVPASMWTPKLRGIELCNMQNGMPAYLCTDLSNISKAIDAEVIILDGKNFSGQLPDDIGKMKKLKRFDINGIDLEKCQPVDIGPCPASIVECIALERLYLASITNTIPNEIINLPNIKFCEYINKSIGIVTLIDKQ